MNASELYEGQSISSPTILTEKHWILSEVLIICVLFVYKMNCATNIRDDHSIGGYLFPAG